MVNLQQYSTVSGSPLLSSPLALMNDDEEKTNARKKESD